MSAVLVINTCRVIVDEALEIGLEAGSENDAAMQDSVLMSPSKMETLGETGIDTLLHHSHSPVQGSLRICKYMCLPPMVQRVRCK